MDAGSKDRGSRTQHRRAAVRLLLPTVALGFVCAGAMSAKQDAGGAGGAPAAATLDETRVLMDKWIETQQVIFKERKEWQQGREILTGRLELVRSEVLLLEQKIGEAESTIAEAARKRDELLAEKEQLKTVGAQMTDAVSAMEVEVRRLFKALPEPIQTRLEPLHQRIPEDPANTRVSTAERFQNVLGILNELNKVNSEISVNYEVHELAGGKPSEVQAIYVGLAQAYYVSGRGESGVGCPTLDGWKWEATDAIAGDVLMALEILQGKHTPAFVPLPVKLR